MAPLCGGPSTISDWFAVSLPPWRRPRPDTPADSGHYASPTSRVLGGLTIAVGLVAMGARSASADAKCLDGTYSSADGPGACSWHLGVEYWLPEGSVTETGLLPLSPPPVEPPQGEDPWWKRYWLLGAVGAGLVLLGRREDGSCEDGDTRAAEDRWVSADTDETEVVYAVSGWRRRTRALTSEVLDRLSVPYRVEQRDVVVGKVYEGFDDALVEAIDVASEARQLGRRVSPFDAEVAIALDASSNSPGSMIPMIPQGLGIPFSLARYELVVDESTAAIVRSLLVAFEKLERATE